jgi:hypothetical protein
VDNKTFCQIAQKGDQMSWQKLAQTVVQPITWYFCNFQKTTQSKQLPKKRKFAQSGHPAQNLQAVNFMPRADFRSAS